MESPSGDKLVNYDPSMSPSEILEEQKTPSPPRTKPKKQPKKDVVKSEKDDRSFVDKCNTVLGEVLFRSVICLGTGFLTAAFLYIGNPPLTQSSTDVGKQEWWKVLIICIIVVILAVGIPEALYWIIYFAKSK